MSADWDLGSAEEKPPAEPVAKGWYTAKCKPLAGNECKAVAMNFTINRGVAGHEGRIVTMVVTSQSILDMVQKNLVNNGWCMIKVCHVRDRDQKISAYINEIHPLSA